MTPAKMVNNIINPLLMQYQSIVTEHLILEIARLLLLTDIIHQR